MQIKKPEKTSSVTSHSNEKILVCNHVKRQPCWLTKQYYFFRRICLNKEFISQFIFLKIYVVIHMKVDIILAVE